MINCKKIQKMITAFDHGQLSAKEEELFLKHLDNCDDCKEEFEIYYIIAYGLSDEEEINIADKQYRELLNRYDFKGLVELKLKNSKKKLEKIYAWNQFLKICWCIANLCVLLSLVLFIIIRYY